MKYILKSEIGCFEPCLVIVSPDPNSEWDDKKIHSTKKRDGCEQNEVTSRKGKKCNEGRITVHPHVAANADI